MGSPHHRPNILILMADRLRYDTLGCAGHPLVQTPSLDHLTADVLRAF
jgi:arylsulfatase A-like enzyme